MNQIICIKTTPDRYQWLENCMKSLSGYSDYPIIILSTGEPSYPQYLKYLNFDEIILLPDSLVVLDTSMFDICFKQYKGKSVSFVGTTKKNKSVYVPFAMGLGKYKRSVLEKLDLPIIKNKEEDYEAEKWFGYEYIEEDPETEVLIPDFFEDTQPPIYLFGRMNKVIRTDYFIKYKGVL